MTKVSINTSRSVASHRERCIRIDPAKPCAAAGWDQDQHFVMSHDFFVSQHQKVVSCGNQFEIVGDKASSCLAREVPTLAPSFNPSSASIANVSCSCIPPQKKRSAVQCKRTRAVHHLCPAFGIALPIVVNTSGNRQN